MNELANRFLYFSYVAEVERVELIVADRTGIVISTAWGPLAFRGPTDFAFDEAGFLSSGGSIAMDA